MSEHRSLDYDGHRLAYRLAGQGPALVVLSLYRRRADMVQARLLSDRWQVFQIAPLGYGACERVPGYGGEALAGQVEAVLNRHGVDRFVVWGYSAGGAMACCIARQTSRAAGVVCGGFAPRPLTAGTLRGLDRRLGPDHPSRSLWWWFNLLDWPDELGAMSCARLFYWGSADRQMARHLRRMQTQLTLRDADFVELSDLDHGACTTPDALATSVIPAVVSWAGRRLGLTW